jgi:rubrerythrin
MSEYEEVPDDVPTVSPQTQAMPSLISHLPRPYLPPVNQEAVMEAMKERADQEADALRYYRRMEG